MLLRPAVPADCPAIAALLAVEINEGVAHFGAHAPTAAQIVRELSEAGDHPWWVAVDGALLGFARATPWKAREAYTWTAEVGVYVAAGSRRIGVGRALIESMHTACARAGFHTLLAGITQPNPASVRLFESCGYVAAGVLPAVGYKAGAWRDVGYWARRLDDSAPTRAPRSRRGLPFVQVDAFAEHPFEGNPAAVVRLAAPLPDEVLRAIAAENNLSETAFLLGDALRWFTPTVEVDLCGHATLAAGAVVLDEDGGDEVAFQTRSGELRVRRSPEGFALDLPVVPWGDGPVPAAVVDALGVPPVEAFPVRSLHHADYFLAVYADAATVRALRPDLGRLRGLRTNVICTAPGEPGLDFVSRFFAPGSGVDEDPVTGSAHATLTPFWAARLGKSVLRARQVGPRSGGLVCELRGDRVQLSGGCVVVLRGWFVVDGEGGGAT